MWSSLYLFSMIHFYSGLCRIHSGYPLWALRARKLQEKSQQRKHLWNMDAIRFPEFFEDKNHWDHTSPGLYFIRWVQFQISRSSFVTPDEDLKCRSRTTGMCSCSSSTVCGNMLMILMDCWREDGEEQRKQPGIDSSSLLKCNDLKIQ